MAKIRNAFNVFAAEDVDLTPVRFDPAGDDVFQEYIVPFGIKKLKLEVVAAKGFNGANGGKVECVLNVKPKQKLFVYAGRMGTSATECIYNASDIRTSDEGITDDTSLHSRLIVAGAGGAYSWGYAAGPGGGLIGGQGGWDIITTGFPGTQTEGVHPPETIAELSKEPPTGEKAAPSVWVEKALTSAVQAGMAAVLEVLLTLEKPANSVQVAVAVHLIRILSFALKSFIPKAAMPQTVMLL